MHGVAYEIEISFNSFCQLPAEGDTAILHTHFVVREDAQLLFGFSQLEERSLFRILIKVNGVGPKLALAILSGMDAHAFCTVFNIKIQPPWLKFLAWVKKQLSA